MRLINKYLSFFIALTFIILMPSLSIANRQFTLLTYNVAGLWGYVSGLDPYKNTPLISKKLNEFNICLFQEDFNYHEFLVQDILHTYRSPHQSILGWGMGYGDGLSNISTFPFDHFISEAWNDCNGYMSNSNDCLTPKGFNFARFYIAEGLIVDIYNLHTNAGSSSADLKTRSKNFSQMLKRVDDWSKGHAVIIAGDTNSRFQQKNGITQFINSGFSDSWVQIYNNNIVPLNKNQMIEHLLEQEKVDKILFRSSLAVKLNLQSLENLKDIFVDEQLNPLSDHSPWLAKFLCKTGDEFQLTNSVGYDSGKLFFNDLTDIPSKFTLKKVLLGTDHSINYIATEYTDGTVLQHGSKDVSDVRSLNLTDDEYINSVTICGEPREHITYIKITSNQGNTIFGGTQSKTCINFSAPDNFQYIGFWGQETLNSSSKGIAQLGLIKQKIK